MESLIVLGALLILFFVAVPIIVIVDVLLPDPPRDDVGWQPSAEWMEEMSRKGFVE